MFSLSLQEPSAINKSELLTLLLLLSHFSHVRLCVTPQTAATRHPRPWDSPGKNTGVGCHFLLQCMKVKSESDVAQSCPTLSDPMDCSLPGSSVHGIFQAKYWSGVPSPSLNYYTTVYYPCHFFSNVYFTAPEVFFSHF